MSVDVLAAARRRLQPGPDDPTDSGDTAWLLMSTALVLLMVPALALFYGGLMHARAMQHTMMLSFVSFLTTALVWSLIGYSLAFAPNPNEGADPWIGGTLYGAFDSRDKVRIGTDISEIAYFCFQMAFCAITAAVVSGSVVGRITLFGWAAFSVVWTIFVYVPLARWIFYPKGWLAALGVMDFAGGLVVETCSGVSAFVLAFWLGPGIVPPSGAHNVPFVLLGLGLLWFGWLGFNGGSALSSGYLSSRAFANTHLCACSAMATWVLLEIALPKLSACVYARRSRSAGAGGGHHGASDADASTAPAMAGRPTSPTSGGSTHNSGAGAVAVEVPTSPSSSASSDASRGLRKPTVPWGTATAVGAASGGLAGLVAITPAAGMVSQMYALLFGVLVVPVCFVVAKNLHHLGVDDRLECLPIHGVAGALGTLLVGIFAETEEGAAFNGAAFGNPAQFGKQLAGLLVTIVVCVLGTTASYWVVKGLGLWLGVPVRVSEEHEADIDKSTHGGYAYDHLSIMPHAYGGLSVHGGGGGSHSGGGGGGGHGAASSSSESHRSGSDAWPLPPPWALGSSSSGGGGHGGGHGGSQRLAVHPGAAAVANGGGDSAPAPAPAPNAAGVWSVTALGSGSGSGSSSGNATPAAAAVVGKARSNTDDSLGGNRPGSGGGLRALTVPLATAAVPVAAPSPPSGRAGAR